MVTDRDGEVDPSTRSTPGPAAGAPTYGLAALLGAASAVTVPIVDVVLTPWREQPSTSLSDGLSRELTFLAVVLAVFLVVQAAAFRLATGGWKPRVYYFPCLAFMTMLALSFPGLWLGLTDSAVGAFAFALVVGGVSALLMEALVDPATERRAMPVLLVVVTVATVTLVGPALGLIPA